MRLSVKGDKATIVPALKRVERIIKIKEHPTLSEGVIELTVYCGEKEDIREEVFNALCEAKTPILEMQSIRMSLEDIFLKVTNKEKPTPIEFDAPPSFDEEDANEAEELIMSREEVSPDAGNL
jgi:ABC-2 type transport system ATP-binding protein